MTSDITIKKQRADVTKKLSKQFDDIYSRTFNKKYWHNVGDYCNRKRHPSYPFSYRRYRRGKNRCDYCGAKIGKIKCKRYSYRSLIADDIFKASPFLKLLKAKGGKIETRLHKRRTD